MRLAPFGLEETHGMLRGQHLHRIAASDASGWTALYASEQVEDPFEGEFDAVSDQLLVLHLDGPSALSTYKHGRVNQRIVPAGGVHLYPAGSDFRVRLHDRLRTVHVYIRTAVIEGVAQKLILGSPKSLSIPPRIVEHDTALIHLLSLVRLCLPNSDHASMLQADFLSRSIACHLIRNYSNANLRRRTSENTERGDAEVFDVLVEYMKANMDGKITIDVLSRVAGLGVAAIHRIYRSLAGLAPHKYLMQLRVERARELIEETNLSITEIAFECGYANQEHLARFYKRQFGLSPSAHRKQAAAARQAH